MKYPGQLVFDDNYAELLIAVKHRYQQFIFHYGLKLILSTNA